MKLPPYFLFNMAKKKAGAREKADKFLAAIGTAGGPIGAPGLVQFGAGDTARQVMSGNVDEYASRCAAGHVDGCLQCHMPKVPLNRSVSFTDHWIRVRSSGEENP